MSASPYPTSTPRAAAAGQGSRPPASTEGEAHRNALPGPSPLTQNTNAPAGASPSAQLTRPAATLFRRPSNLQGGASTSGVGSTAAHRAVTSGMSGGNGGTRAPDSLHHLHPTGGAAAATTSTTMMMSPGCGVGGAGLRQSSPAIFGRSPNPTRTRQSYGSSVQSPVMPHPSSGVASTANTTTASMASSSSPFAVPPPRGSAAAAERASGVSPSGSPATAAPAISTLPNSTPLAGLSNHLRLSEGLSSIDYHAGFRALAIGSTRQIHVVEVIPMVGHDVAATARHKRSQQQQQLHEHQLQQQQAGDPQHSPLDGEPIDTAAGGLGAASSSSPATSPAPSPPPPAPLGTAPFLMRNTGVFGGLIKVESVAWYPSTEEASLAFIQPGRTVTIFLDALQFKADGTYLPQQWTRSQYKGKMLSAAMAAGGGSTAMAVVANLDGGLAGMTPATSTTSLGERSGMYTPVSTSLAGGASFSGAPASHGGTPHESSLPTPNSGGSQSGPNLAMSNLPCVNRERKGPAAKELIELNIDITYMRVEKIVWDPHQPYTLALSSPTTHFELWQVPTDGTLVYGPQLVLRPPAHNTRSVVRDLVFSPSNPHIIIVVTECGNAGQVLLYDRRQVEAMRVFDMSGPGLSAAFHPLFSDLLAVSFRKEKTKPDTRISFLRVMSGDTMLKAGDSAPSSPDAPLTAPEGILRNSSAYNGGSGNGGGGVGRGSSAMTLMNPSALAAAMEEGLGNGGPGTSVGPASASACPFLAEQPYLPPIDNYACVSRMRWRPPSLGRLTEPKRHHYMSFKPSAEELWAARHLATFRAADNRDGEDTNWADVLHSQLWFASAAVTTDSDLSVWDAANGFFPVCAVKYLGTRADSSTSNEANDFIWINELTLVSIFKSGEVICTSFLNSLLEEILSAGEVHERAARLRRGGGGSSSSNNGTHAVARPLRSRSSAAAPARHRTSSPHQPSEAGRARDEYAEQRAKVRAEEMDCLAMLPAYPHDPCADMFATYIVLPTSSIVSDLFGRSFAIRNSNAAVRRRYNAMLRREFGQLLRRLAIQVSREAVLRKEWSEMRFQLPIGSNANSGGPGSPGVLSGLAALQELRARRPRSPFTQTSNFHGRGTSSQGSDSTPPSPRRSMLTRRYSAASSTVSSFSARGAVQPSMGVGAQGASSGAAYNNTNNSVCIATAANGGVSTQAGATMGSHGTSVSAHCTLPPPPANAALTTTMMMMAASPPLPPAHAWSLDDVNDALLLQAASLRGSNASPTNLYDEGDNGSVGHTSVNGGGGGGGAVAARGGRGRPVRAAPSSSSHHLSGAGTAGRTSSVEAGANSGDNDHHLHHQHPQHLVSACEEETHDDDDDDEIDVDHRSDNGAGFIARGAPTASAAAAGGSHLHAASTSGGGGGGATAWIARLLGFSRHERVHRYRSSISEARAAAAAPPLIEGLVEASGIEEDAADAALVSSTGDLTNLETAGSAFPPNVHAALARRRQPCGQPTSPISVSPIDQSESSIGSPQQLSTAGVAAAAGSPLQAPDSGGEGGSCGAASAFPSRGKPSVSHSAQQQQQRANSAGPRPGTSAGSSSPLLTTGLTTDVGGLSNGHPQPHSQRPSSALTSAPGGVLYRASGGGANHSSPAVSGGPPAASAAASVLGPGSHRNRRSGVVFTQVFPLLKEYVNVGHDRSPPRGGRSARSASAPPANQQIHHNANNKTNTANSSGSGSLRSPLMVEENSASVPTVTVNGGPVSSSGAFSTASRDATVDASAERGPRKPTLLLSPLLHPKNGDLRGEQQQQQLLPTTSPLQLPLSVPATKASAPQRPPPTSKPATNTTAATTAAASSKESRSPTHLITARAYLDRQRDVTAVVESFALSDVVCGWSYTERQREEFAFVRFALEWDMGYELALTMKALRHDRADAEAAAEVALAAEAASLHYPPPDAQGPPNTLKPDGSGLDGGPMLLQQEQQQQQEGRRRRSSSSGSGAHGRLPHRDRVAQEKYSPNTVYSPNFPSGRPRSRSEGARGTGHGRPYRRSVDSNDGGYRPLLDWGCGAPAPTHQDVDDKVAAMMEENARICEGVVRQQRAQQQQQNNKNGSGSNGAGGSAGGKDSASDNYSPAFNTNTAVSDHWNVDGGEASSPFMANNNNNNNNSADAATIGSLNTTDPRAQWWRAAAHAWRSHHLSFILSITTQQLEYAALMGDVQYCLVLYILFCVWWRLHSEVAEAAYKAALTALYEAKYGSSRDGRRGGRGDAYGQMSGSVQDHQLLRTREDAWAGDDLDGKDGFSQRYARQPRNAQPFPRVGGGSPAAAASLAADRRRGMLRVSTLTSVDGSCHDDVAPAASSGVVHATMPFRTSAAAAAYMRATAFASPYGSPEVSEGEQHNSNNNNNDDDNAHHNSGGDHRTYYTTASGIARLERLHRLCLFFQRCPLMPMLPDAPGRSASAATTTTASATTNPGGSGMGGGEAMDRGPLGSMPGTNSAMAGGAMGQSRGGPPSSANGGFNTYLRPSASNQSLPTRSQNSSSRRLNETPATPAMADHLRDHGSTRASLANMPVMGSSHRSSNASPVPANLRAEGKNSSNNNNGNVVGGGGGGGSVVAKQGNDKQGKSNAAARLSESRLVLFDLEGLLGVRLHAQTMEDLYASADFCAPEEWKLRALQWLETYTADLYARQLYVPLNELLLVMPEIFREPTNPVQPRAADIAYEKQMTYVYCGSCSKAELWSRTQQETVPAAVRLYERVLRRGPHSSSSEKDDDDDDTSASDAYSIDGEGVGCDCCSGNEEGVSCGRRNQLGVRGRKHRFHRGRGRHRRTSSSTCSSHHSSDDFDVAISGTREGGRRRRKTRAAQQAQKRRRRHQHATSHAAPDQRGSRGCNVSGWGSEDDSSCIDTPSVESPTSSSDVDASTDGAAQSARDKDSHTSSMNSDVSLSSEHSTPDGEDNEHRNKTKSNSESGEGGSVVGLFDPARVSAANAAAAAAGGGTGVGAVGSRLEPGDSSSRVSTPGGSRGSAQGTRMPPLPHTHSLPDLPPTYQRAQQQKQQQQRHSMANSPMQHPSRLPRRHLSRLHHHHHSHRSSRHSLDDDDEHDHFHGESSGELRRGLAEDDEDGGGDGGLRDGYTPLDGHHGHVHRHTAVGCEAAAAAPTANNAACRRCHNRTAMTCVVCEEVVEGVFFWLRGCGHGGHVHHIEEWLRYSQECPKCGTPITATWKGS